MCGTGWQKVLRAAEAMLAETILADLGARVAWVRWCTVHAHVLHVLGCGFNACDISRVVVKACKCTGCTGMLVQVHGLHHRRHVVMFADTVSANMVSVLQRFMSRQMGVW